MTFRANNLATTVGAAGLKSEIVVSQPLIQIPIEEEVEYEFDQQKYEEHLASLSGDSSRSASPRRFKRTSAARKARWASDPAPQREDSYPATAKEATRRAPPASTITKISRSPDLTSSVQEMIANGAVTLSKRARQRRRQSLARQFAKALLSTDGVSLRRSMKTQPGVVNTPSKPPTNEWVRVKRNRSTLEERIQRRRALFARARALVKEAQDLKEEVVKKPLQMRQVWRPKSGTTTRTKPQVDLIKTPPPQTSIAKPPPKETVFQRLGPLHNERRGEVPIQEHLGPLKRPRTSKNTGGRIINLLQKESPAAAHFGLRIEVQEPAKTSRPQRRVSRRVTLENHDGAVRPQKETPSSDDDGVTPEESCHSSFHATKAYYHAGGTSRSCRKSSPESNTVCPCSKIIKAVLSECKCTEVSPTKASVFDRLGSKISEAKPRRFNRRRRMSRDDGLPRVTSNVVDKRTPSKAGRGTSQRLTRLRSGTIRRSDYKKMQKGLPSDGETSETGSVLASDNTVDSEGQSQEAFMISAENVSKMLEEAMAKQKESFKFEMDMVVQRMREMHDQQIQALMNQQTTPNRRDNDNTVDSDTERDEGHNAGNHADRLVAGNSPDKANEEIINPPQGHHDGGRRGDTDVGRPMDPSPQDAIWGPIRTKRTPHHG